MLQLVKDLAVTNPTEKSVTNLFLSNLTTIETQPQKNNPTVQPDWFIAEIGNSSRGSVDNLIFDNYYNFVEKFFNNTRLMASQKIAIQDEKTQLQGVTFSLFLKANDHNKALLTLPIELYELNSSNGFLLSAAAVNEKTSTVNNVEDVNFDPLDQDIIMI